MSSINYNFHSTELIDRTRRSIGVEILTYILGMWRQNARMNPPCITGTAYKEKSNSLNRDE